MIGLEKLEPGPEPGPSIMDKLGTVHACGSRAEGLENQLSLGLAGHLVRLNLEAPGSVKTLSQRKGKRTMKKDTWC